MPTKKQLLLDGLFFGAVPQAVYNQVLPQAVQQRPEMLFQPQQAQSAPQSPLAALGNTIGGGGQNWTPDDWIRVGRELARPVSNSPWADTMSPERREMYGRLGGAPGTPGNAYSWDTTDQKNQWARAASPGQLAQIDQNVVQKSIENQQANGWVFPTMDPLLRERLNRDAQLGIAPYTTGFGARQMGDYQGPGIYDYSSPGMEQSPTYTPSTGSLLKKLYR